MSGVRYDVFLSHSSADKPQVEELARQLKRKGIEPFLDKWNLILGQPWQEALEEALTGSASCAVLIGPGRRGPWQNLEMRTALNHRVRESRGKYPVIPVLLPGATRPDEEVLPLFLRELTWVEFPENLDDEATIHRLVSGIRGIEPGPGPEQAVFEGQCPYRGLEPFEEKHASFFFGREARIEWLMKNVLGPAARSSEAARFLAVIGPSGSGKSSLALGGLVPALRAGKLDGSSEWPVVVFRPGYDPIESLAVALSGLDHGTSLLAQTREFLGVNGFGDSPRCLHVFSRLALRDAPGSCRLVVVADQFEEVFTLCNDETSRRALITNLLDASTAVGGKTLVILTIRADFYGKCAAYPELAAALSDHQELVGSLTEDEIRCAIERPAVLVGCEFEQGLIDLLLRDVEGESGALPLLQFALLELWRLRHGRRLTIAAYRQLGAVQGALERRANAILMSFDDAGREICRRVFLRLTQPGEGTEDTKRRVPNGELLGVGADIRKVEEIIRRLADARLITTGARDPSSWVDEARAKDGYVEVAHEALIRGWSELRRWIESDRSNLRVHRQLTEAAREWRQHSGDASLLYQGTRLAVVRDWLKSHSQELNTMETEFLDASERQEHRRRADAERLARDTRSRQLAALAQVELGRSLDRALLLSVAAVQLGDATDDTSDARRCLFSVLNDRSGLRAFLHQDNGPITGIAFSHDDRMMALGFGGMYGLLESAVLLYDVAAGRKFGNPHTERDSGGPPDNWAFDTGSEHVEGVIPYNYANPQWRGVPIAVREGRVTSVAFSPDGTTLAAGYDNGGSSGVVLCDVAAGRRLGEPIPIEESGLACLAFSPDGKAFALGYCGAGANGIILCDVATRSRIDSLELKDGYISSVAVSPSGALLAAGYGSFRSRGGLILYDFALGRWRGEPIAVHEGRVTSVAFSPDGAILAAGFDGGAGSGVALYDVAAGRRRGEPIPIREGRVNGVAYSPDGRALAAGYGSAGQGGVHLCYTAVGQWLGNPLDVSEGQVACVAFSGDSQALAAGYRDDFGRGGVVLFDVDPESWQRRACRVARRDFSPEEWVRYIGPDIPYRRLCPEFRDRTDREDLARWSDPKNIE
jgi:WD40 repeat protein